MQIKLFTVPITAVADYNEEINAFLRGNKIMEPPNVFSTKKPYLSAAISRRANFSKAVSGTGYSFVGICKEGV